jgi:Mn2+/Fe2+ NRAMP family transporter
MYWLSKGFHVLNRFKRRLLIFLAVLGPGIITMVADNDAGGISTYAVTGSKYGFGLLWIFIILVPMAYYVQEMTVRLGAVTKRGHAEAIFEGFGKFWGWFSLADLCIVNWLTLITEYIGMTAAMSLLGVPPWLTVIGVTLILFGVVISGRYWTFERLTLFFCLFNLVYVPAAFWGMKTPTAPGWGDVFKGLLVPNLPGGFSGELMFIILANIGTTIAPWMIFFQQSAVVDKGLDVHDIKYGKLETFVGSVMTCLVAAFIIIATAGVFYFNPDPDPKWRMIDSAAQTAAAMPQVFPHGHLGQWAKMLFAIGLFDAGLLGALCISLATSWALGEVFGWAHSLNRSVRDAPWFYVAYVLMLMSAGVVSLIASVDVQNIITIFVQVIAVTLLPAALTFLILLLNDKPLMGDHVNNRWENIANWSITLFVIIISTAYGVSVLFPEFFGSPQ